MVYWVDNGTGWRIRFDSINKARLQAIMLAKEPDWASRKFGKAHFAMGERTYDNAVPIYASESGKTIIGYVVSEKMFNNYWVTMEKGHWKYQNINEDTGKLVPANVITPTKSDWNWTKFNYRIPNVNKRRGYR